MAKTSQNEPILALSPRLIFGILAVSGLIAFLLLPNERTLIERLMRDGSYEKALKLSLDTSQAKRARSARFFTYVDLRCQRMILKTPSAPEQFRLLDRTLHAYSQFQFAEEFFPEILSLASNLAPESGLQPKLKPFVDRMPRESKRVLTETLVPLYLAHDQTLAAAHTYTDYWRIRPHGEKEVLEMVKLWRFSENPSNALDAVDAWLPRAKNLERETRRAFDRLRIDLLREQNSAEDAFLATKALYAQSTTEEQSGLFELLTETAIGSGNAKKVLPEMIDRAKLHPNDARLWRSILDLSAAEGELKIAIEACKQLRRLDPKDSKIIMSQAQFYEWQDNASDAFDAYMDALKFREPGAVDRLLKLNEGLYRDAELADAIEAQPGITRGRAIALPVARLLARANKFESAKRNFEFVVEQSKGKVEPVLEYGSLLSALFDYDEALKLFDNAVRANPENESLKQQLAETHMRLENPEEAIRIYEELVPSTTDEEMLNKLLVLAESSGKIDTARATIRRKLKIGKNVAPEDYLRLDYFDTLVGAIDKAAETVKEGVARFPQDEMLRLQAGYTLSTAKQYNEALAILKEHKSLKTNPAIVQIYLSLLILGQNFKEARTFISGGIAPEHLAIPAIVELRAQVEEAENKLLNAIDLLVQLRQSDRENVVYALNHARLLSVVGKNKEALEILTPHLNSRQPEVLQLASQVFSAAGEHRKAEMFQRAYLATEPKELPQAWGFLGDIYLSIGSKIDAKRAYKRGLQELIIEVRERKEKQ